MVRRSASCILKDTDSGLSIIDDAISEPDSGRCHLAKDWYQNIKGLLTFFPVSQLQGLTGHILAGHTCA
jgi:hypothetical protein